MVCCKCRHSAQYSQTLSKWLIGICDLLASGYQLFMRLLGPILFIGANILILSVAIICILIYLPLFYKNSSIAYFFHTFSGSYLLINIIFNYFCCSLTPAGSPLYCPDPGKLLGEKMSIVNGRKIYQFSHQLNLAPYVSYRYCHICKCIKPPRAHHCSVSGRCIYHMDHYCPWMATCVGFNNYRYFILFLIYLQIGCYYVIAMLLSHEDILPPADRYFIHLLSSLRGNIFSIDLTASAFCFSIALAGAISTGILLSWHLYLCFTNQTSIEFYINMRNKQDAYASNSGVPYRNPFDEGWRKNIRRVFGYVPWYRNLYPSFHKPPPPKYPFELEARSQISMNV